MNHHRPQRDGYYWTRRHQNLPWEVVLAIRGVGWWDIWVAGGDKALSVEAFTDDWYAIEPPRARRRG